MWPLLKNPALLLLAGGFLVGGFLPGGSRPVVFGAGERDQAREILGNRRYQKRLGEGPVSSRRRPVKYREKPAGEPREKRQPFVLPGAGFVLEILVWTVLGAVALVLIYLVARSILSGTTTARDGAEDVAEPEEGEVREIDRTGMEKTMKKADRLAEQGRFTEAIRFMFRDAARRIEDERAIHLVDSDTNHEYLDRLEEADRFRSLTEILVDALDRFYYGGRSCSEEEYRKCRTAWKRVQSPSGTG